MKVLNLFIHFTDEQYFQLMKEHKDEIAVKTFLSVKLSKIINDEVDRIKEEDFKSIDILGKAEKL